MPFFIGSDVVLDVVRKEAHLVEEPEEEDRSDDFVSFLVDV